MSHDAAYIAHQLGAGKEVPNGKGWLTLCCYHNNTDTPALSVTDNDDGSVTVYCHAGCNWKDVKKELANRGLLPEGKPEKKNGRHHRANEIQQPPEEPVTQEKESYIWKRASRDNLEPVKKYLAGRGITIDPLPICIKFNSYTNKNDNTEKHTGSCQTTRKSPHRSNTSLAPRCSSRMAMAGATIIHSDSPTSCHRKYP